MDKGTSSGQAPGRRRGLISHGPFSLSTLRGKKSYLTLGSGVWGPVGGSQGLVHSRITGGYIKFRCQAHPQSLTGWPKGGQESAFPSGSPGNQTWRLPTPLGSPAGAPGRVGALCLPLDGQTGRHLGGHDSDPTTVQWMKLSGWAKTIKTR